jgi:hypothetical protein
MITLFLLSGVVGYLGDVCFELQRSWVRAETALSNLGTMLEITYQFWIRLLCLLGRLKGFPHLSTDLQ